jgi:diadenosine tetraphosphate (Ap4A) HIT family hydrolase
MTSEVTEHRCAMCELATSLADDAVAYRDDEWTIGMAVEVPGRPMLLTNAHIEGLDGLDDARAAAFGRLAARLTRAIKDVCGAERVYLVYQGEHAAHFHAMAMARGADIPADWRGMALLGHRDELTDPVAARQIVAAVRQQLAATG